MKILIKTEYFFNNEQQNEHNLRIKILLLKTIILHERFRKIFRTPGPRFLRLVIGPDPIGKKKGDFVSWSGSEQSWPCTNREFIFCDKTAGRLLTAKSIS